MIYYIQSVINNDNILGFKYEVMVVENNFDFKNARVLQEGEKSNVKEIKTFECGYDSQLQHKSTIMNCLEWSVINAIDRKCLNDSTFIIKTHKYKE